MRNSFRVSVSLNPPLNPEVVVVEFCFWTPRIIIYIWDVSITIATPFGFKVLLIQSKICSVSRSWTWSLREKTSTILGSLLKPTIFLQVYRQCLLFRKKEVNDVHIRNIILYPSQLPFHCNPPQTLHSEEFVLDFFHSLRWEISLLLRLARMFLINPL